MTLYFNIKTKWGKHFPVRCLPVGSNLFASISRTVSRFTSVKTGAALFFMATFLLVTTANVLAQAPGGVSANLNVWVKGNAGTSTTTDGAGIATWANQGSVSGNFTALTAVGGTSQPTYKAIGYNYNPMVQCTVNQGFGFLNALSTTTANVSVYVVHKNTRPASNGFTMFASFTNSTFTAAGSINPQLGYYDDGNAAGPYIYYYPNAGNTSMRLARNTPAISAWLWNNTAAITPKLNGLSGATIANGTTTNAQNLMFNVESDGGADDGSGDYAEAIVFQQKLNAADQQKVESYLALKYGISLDQTTAYDYKSATGTTFWSATTNGLYKNNIFGLGRDDASALNQKQAYALNDSAISISFGPLANTNNAKR